MDSSCKKSSGLMKRLSHKSVVILMLVTVLGGFVAMVAGALVPSGDAWAIRWSELGKCGDGESSGWEMTNKRPQYSNPDANHPEGYLNSYLVDATCAATGETIKDVVVPKSDIPVDPGDGINCIIITTAAGKAVSCNGTVGPMYTGDVPKEAIDEARQQAKDNMDANACRSGQALLSLGWFLCPIMDMMSQAVEDLYSSVESMLKVEPTFFTGGDNNVAAAWGTFRDMANVVFVILLLVVIFSQITGVGINNYGIKKLLPKMIVAAILINLSYVICQIAIDLSNILGNGLQNLFEAMGNNLSMAESINIAGDDALTLDSAIANVALPSAAVLAAIVGVAAVFANPFILISVLVSAVSILFSLFFLFLLLVARKAAVIVLVAISPLAFVCYMLPNTKSLFDKWFKGMEGLLLLYPICGLIVGGGGYVSKLLLSTSFGEGGFVQVFAAMIVGIIPIFFIPTLLKNSFSAIGNIGAKISGIGQGLSKGATGAIRNTDAYKNAQEMGQARALRRKAGLDKNGQLNLKGRTKARLANTRMGRALGYDKAMARNVSQVNKNTQEQEAAGAMLAGRLAQQGVLSDANTALEDGEGNTLFSAKTEGAYYGKQFLEAAEAGDIGRMNSVIQAMDNSGMQKKDIAKLLRHAESSGKVNLDEFQAFDWHNRISKQYGNGFLATDAELGHFMQMGGRDKGGNRVQMEKNYGDYASKYMGHDDFKAQDAAAWSGDSFAGMVASGLFTKDDADKLIASNPNVSADKSIMYNAVRDGNAVGGIERDAEGKAVLVDGNVQYLDNATVKGGGEAVKFKDDATKLMIDHSAVPENGTIRNVNEAVVDNWTRSKPQRVEIVPPQNPNNQNN